MKIEKRFSGATALAALALRKLLFLSVSALILTAPFVIAGAAKAQVYGIGGYDLASPNDQVFAFDYDNSGKADHLVFYRPGAGVIWILANAGGLFTPAFQSTSGIGGFDLMSTSDIGIAYDATSTGKYDGMLFYRPGTNVAYSMHNLGSGFPTTYVSGYGGNGLGISTSRFDLSSPADRLTAVTVPGDPRVYLIGYRPGAQIASLIFPGPSNFTVGNYSTSGLGGYDLRSQADQLISFDYNSTGLPDQILAYRPGQGIAWILQWVGLANSTSYSPVFQSAFNSQLGYSGIGGFDLRATADRIISFDYNSSGHSNHFLIYRPGTGVVWILQNVAGAFSPVYASDYLPADYGTAALSGKTIALGENLTPQ